MCKGCYTGQCENCDEGNITADKRLMCPTLDIKIDSGQSKFSTRWGTMVLRLVKVINSNFRIVLIITSFRFVWPWR